MSHVSHKVNSIDDAKAFLADTDIELTGEFNFKGLQAIFIHDPDRNVIELDYYPDAKPMPPKTRYSHIFSYVY